jgi:hypothetical protein
MLAQGKNPQRDHPGVDRQWERIDRGVTNPWRRRKVGRDRRGTVVKRIVFLVLLSFFLRVVALLVVPDPSKPTIDTSILIGLIGTVDRYLHFPSQRWQRGVEETDAPEDSPVQRIRDEVVLTRLSEMALSEEPKPPLPRVSLLPPGKLDENEQMRILERSRFYHELEEQVRKGEREKGLSDVPGPKTSDVKDGDIPLPEDREAQRIIATLREEAQEEVKGKKSIKADTVGIKGPAASRTISYIPDPLQVKVSMGGDALLKFWVLPDGTVSRVIPLAEGEDRTTVEALNLLKKYRFDPLPADIPQVKMWGTIPVKSVLK